MLSRNMGMALWGSRLFCTSSRSFGSFTSIPGQPNHWNWVDLVNPEREVTRPPLEMEDSKLPFTRLTDSGSRFETMMRFRLPLLVGPILRCQMRPYISPSDNEPQTMNSCEIGSGERRINCGFNNSTPVEHRQLHIATGMANGKFTSIWMWTPTLDVCVIPIIDQILILRRGETVKCLTYNVLDEGLWPEHEYDFLGSALEV